MKIKDKKTVSILICLSTVLILFVAIVVKMLFKEKALATNTEQVELKTYKKAEIEDFNIDKIIEENINNTISQEIVTEEVDLEYTTIYKNNEGLPNGQMQVLQEGRDGKQIVVNKKTYQNGELIKEEQTGRTVTKSSINKIVEVGTGGTSKSKHKVQKGDIMYVTSYTLNMMQEPDKNSNKITTLSKSDEVKVIEISNEWYKISYKSFNGWVDANCLKYREENKLQAQVQVISGKNKEQAISSLNENMKLNSPSGLSLEQFKKILSNNDNDKNKIFEKNAEYFYYIEQQYNINGLFVAAVGIHESGWGTSKISLDKKNLFGYGANDSNPYDNAYSFGSYSEGIDLLARVFVKYYINPAGTKIYDNETATGKYYSGPTIADVNKKYASDKNWNKAVYKWMTYLYNRL